MLRLIVDCKSPHVKLFLPDWSAFPVLPGRKPPFASDVRTSEEGQGREPRFFSFSWDFLVFFWFAVPNEPIILNRRALTARRRWLLVVSLRVDGNVATHHARAGWLIAPGG
jgi:hypothetical protein